MASYAIILTHNREASLIRCINAIAPQIDELIVVDNASTPRMRITSEWPSNARLIYDPEQPPNLAKMWNKQLRRIETRENWFLREQWDVAFLCDDSPAPAGWFVAAAGGMRAHGGAAGCTHAITAVTQAIIKTAPDNDIWNRMTGWAFLLAGEKGLRADENMHWWWVDSDLDVSARNAGGMVISPGPVVPNEEPGAWTNAKPELTMRAGLDREAYVAKHGSAPW